MPNNIPDQDRAEAAFVTWSDESSKDQALANVQGILDDYDGIQRSSAYARRSFLDIEPNISVRTGFDRRDYDRFRSGESVPQKQKDAIRMCMAAYDRVGLVRNVIDLMGDFACQGINLVHPNKRIEKFYKAWFIRINGKERSERFLNLLYRTGNVILKRRTAKITKKIEEELRRSSGKADIVPESIKINRREIPWKYDFLNPMSVEVLGQELATFVGKPQFALKISSLLKRHITNGSKNPYHQRLLAQLPADVLKAVKQGISILPLDVDKTSVFYYKKDDWLTWANPMIYAILDDILMLEKMKLADISALDGAISNIRLWRIGDLENKILPTKGAINKLRNILAGNVGGGTMDLVWGPEIDFKESNTQVYKFLGSEKYQPVLTNIYAGLGIPPTLTGLASGGSGGFTNNFISLRVLLERLEYGRNILMTFWRQEIEIIQKAMGFRFPATVHFDQMTLSDESSEKNLLIQLADRDIISAETVQERFGEVPDIEKIRIKREAKERQNERMPQKSGPYHNPQHLNDLEKIALQKDLIAPEDVGIVPCDETGDHPFTDPDDRRSDQQIQEKKEEVQDKQDERDQKKFDNQQKQNPPNEGYDPKGRPEDGRPKNAKDKTKRKQKEVKPRVAASTDFANTLLWATKAQKQISDIVNPALLAHYGKKNLRALTKQETDEAEYIKLCVLSNISPFDEIDARTVKSILDQNLKADPALISLISSINNDFVEANIRNPSLEESRQIQISAYAISR